MKHRLAYSRYFRRLMIFMCLLVVSLLPVMNASAAWAYTSQDIFDTLDHKPFYDPSDAGCSGGPITAVDVTGNNVKDAYNFFTSNGYSPEQAAGIVGNFIIESGVNPKAVNSIGATGIAQWLGGRLTAMRAWVSSQQQDPNSLQGQLLFVVHELGTSETQARDKLKATNDPKGAAEAWFTYYERAGDSSLPARQAAAVKVFNQYAAGVTGTATDNCTPGSSSGSPDCQTATGVAKILCEAKKYDPVSYREVGAAGHQGGAAWHKTCPTIGPSCILDCSGLVTVATYDAFGNNGSWNTGGLYGDTKNWKHITLGQAVPGDLIMPNPGHVEVIDHISGNTVYAFGAHTDSVPQPEQVGPDSYLATGNFAFLHYIGLGSSG